MNEHPKQAGWYWYRSVPGSAWRPVNVSLTSHDNPDRSFLKFDDNHYSEGETCVDDTWPQQWGGKIEQPKEITQ